MISPQPSSVAPSAALSIEPVSQPHVLVAPMAASSSAPSITTTRQWVVPPRPKPGRKPATDPPPTKRKAQNRAAQRAFRERRAARVGELEEELEETREEQQMREAEMRKRITSLEAEVLRFTEELQSWKMRCDTLDKVVEYEKSEKEAALIELSYVRSGALSTSTDAVPIPPRRSRTKGPEAPVAPQFAEGPLNAEHGEPPGCGNCSLTECACVERAIALSTATCGRCSTDSHCECLEETIKAASDMPASVVPKRSHSPPLQETSSKRHRPPEPAAPLEIDFTAEFSSKAKQQTRSTQDIPTSEKQPAESCGFCEDGTFCVCAEAAAVAVQGAEHGTQLQVAPLLNEITPPPSDTDISGSGSRPKPTNTNTVHPSIVSDAPGAWGNEPGTCQQCQSDPKSGIFCRSLAAARNSTASSTASSKPDCCGGNEAGGQCCKTLVPVQPTRAPPSLSCADTYKVLSTHKGFDKAGDNFDSWLARLQTTSSEHAGRAPLEVEAASVMGVLKLFDRRFGQN
jgi:hypothetical protein